MLLNGILDYHDWTFFVTCLPKWRRALSQIAQEHNLQPFLEQTRHMLSKTLRHRKHCNAAMDIERPKTVETDEREQSCTGECVDMLMSEGWVLASKCGTCHPYADCANLSQDEAAFLYHTQQL